MANTQALKKVVEPFVRRWLEKRYGQEFQTRELPVGRKSNGEEAVYEFDAVSSDGAVAANISTAGELKAGQLYKLFYDAYMLHRASATKKLLILTERKVAEDLERRGDGKLPADVETVVCELKGQALKAARSARRSARAEMR